MKVELPEVVNKTLEKPAQTLGEKLSDLLEIILGGITYKRKELSLKRELNFESFRNQLIAEIEKIPVEKRVEPEESIVGPALEALKYRLDKEQVRTMFAKLIANSINEDEKNTIHPAFIEVLKNLSANDAKAITDMAILKHSALMPIISLKEDVLVIPNKSKHYCALVDDFGVEDSNVVISSLQRNGLVEIVYCLSKENELYDFSKMLKEFNDYRKVEENYSNYNYGILSLTAFGYEFAKECCPETINEVFEIQKLNEH